MFCRVGGPIFFANVNKFVDHLYSDIVRPSKVVVSDDRQELQEDPRRRTSPDDVEMNGFHTPNGTAGSGGHAYGVAQTTMTAVEHEAADPNDSTEEIGVPRQKSDSDRVRIIVMDCYRVSFFDSTAIAALKKIHAAYRKVGVELVLSGCDAKMMTVMSAAGLLDVSEGKIEIYPTVHDALLTVV